MDPECINFTSTSKTMSSTGSTSSLLPPLEGEESAVLMDWETDFIYDCPKCPGLPGILYADLEGHRKWHVRVNLLLQLRDEIKKLNMPVFGPSEPGILVRVDHTAEDKEEEFTKLQILSKRNTLRYVHGLKYTFGNKYVGRESQGEFIYTSLEEEEGETLTFNDFDLDDESQHDTDSEDDRNRNYGAEGCGGEDYNDDDDEDEDDMRPQEERNPRERSPVQVEERPVRDENYFTLECKDDGIWISTGDVVGLGPSTAIFVNGLPQAPSSPTRKLVFGDILTLTSFGEGDEGRQESRFRDYVFKAATDSVSKEKGQGTEVAVQAFGDGALQNPLVFQNIFEFLSTARRKALRLVSHRWNGEALSSLRNRIVLTVFDGNKWNNSGNQMQILHYSLSEFSRLQFPHWRIVLPSEESRRALEERTANESHRKAASDAKMTDDWTWLLDPGVHTHFVKSLILDCNCIGERESGMLGTLVALVGASLTELNLKIGGVTHFPLPQGDFPGLQSLHLEWTGLSISSRFLTQFLREFLPKVRSIRTLTLEKAGVAEKLFQVMQAEDGPKFGNLRSVSILSIGAPDCEGLSLLPARSLRKLTLGELHPFSGREQLRSALQRHAHSLEELTLHFSLGSKVPVIYFDFPQSLPKLKTLSILVGCERSQIGLRRWVRCSFGSAVPNIHDVTPNPVDYRATFPSLDTLTVWPADRAPLDGNVSLGSVDGARWDEFFLIQKAFFSPVRDEAGEPIPMRGLKTGNTPFLLQGMIHLGINALEVIFPNAVFPPELVAAARGQPIWNHPAVAQEAGLRRKKIQRLRFLLD